MTYGPVDYLALEFKNEQLKGEILPALLELVQKKIVRVIDLIIIQKYEDGHHEALEMEQLAPDLLSVFNPLEVEISGIIQVEDIADIAEAMADWDFGGTRLNKAVNANTNGQFRSQHEFYASATRTFEGVSNTELRGGPSSLWPGGWEIDGNFVTDGRRKLRAEIGAWTFRRDEDSRDVWSAWAGLTYQPTNSLRLSCNPSYEHNDNEMQYVQTSATAAGDRYLFGRLDQYTAMLTFRLDLCLTPGLTVQYYGAPFISAGSYTEFKRITDPRADRYEDRFLTFAESEITPVEGGYDVDEDGDAVVDYTIGNPDFNVRDFNSNLVLRWEYGLGSTIYLVWSQGRTDVVDDGDFDLREDVDDLFATHPEDVFLVKINKWFSL